MTEASRGNLMSLQILRAIASTSVIYLHIEAAPNFGNFGVDIFFVLSGFVMAMVIANGQTTYDFAASRIARIVPMYWLLTTAVLALAAVRPGLFNSTTANIPNYLKSLFFIPYFKENGELHPMLAVGWTLNYEMFFYGCLLVALALCRRYYLAITLAILGVAYGIGLGEFLGRAARNFLGNNLIFEFSFGLVAFHVRQRRWFPKTSASVSFLLIVAAYAFMAFMETHEMASTRFLVFGLPSVVILLAITNLEDSGILHGNWLATVLAKIGDASYATYLSHAFIVSAVRKIVGEKLHLLDPYTPYGVAIVIAVALVVGQLLYVLFDRPLSRLFRRLLMGTSAQRAVTSTSVPADAGRTAWVDAAKGLGIVLVVFGHVFRGLHAAGLPMDEKMYRLIDSVIYTFHMPLFFFLAGLFFFDSLAKRGWKSLLANKFDTILYPYILWSLLQGAIEVMLSRWTNGKASMDDVLRLWEPRAQMWFLLALFLVTLLACLFYGRLKRQEVSYILPSGMLIYFMAGNLVHPTVVDQTMTYFVFFAAGVAFNEIQAWLMRNRYPALVVSSVVAVILQWYFHDVLSLTFSDLGVWALTLAAVSVLAFVALCMVLSEFRINWLLALGQASMAIYLMHILAGSGTRIALMRLLHVDSVIAHAMLGTSVGLLLPFLAYKLLRWIGAGFLFDAPRICSLQRVVSPLVLQRT